MIRRALEKDRESLRRLIAEFYVDNKKTYSKTLQDLEEYKDNNKVVDEIADKYLHDKKYILLLQKKIKNPQYIENKIPIN